jgi:general L-amino acid transport system substrate-binding protein
MIFAMVPGAIVAVVSVGAAAACACGLLDRVESRGTRISAGTPVPAGLALPGRQADSHKVKFVPLLSMDRFTAQQSGDLVSRDMVLGRNFGGTDHCGGQGFPVREELSITSAQDMSATWSTADFTPPMS